jgi:DisA bacterial checkpoint controller nucleotide-binding
MLAACRYLDASVEQIDLPLGFGSRHLTAASISKRLGAIAIVVSESGVVRVFHGGQIEATLIPALWLLDRHQPQLSAAAAGAVEAQRLGAAALGPSRQYRGAPWQRIRKVRATFHCETSSRLSVLPKPLMGQCRQPPWRAPWRVRFF